MTGAPLPPEDRVDPDDRSPHLRARVPDHVADGAFSTGAIVVTGPNEFIIDFLQTIGRPHRVASRVIIPHAVMPQFIEALATNLRLYRERFGDPPLPPGFAGPATAIGATGVPHVQPHAPPLQPHGSQPSPQRTGPAEHVQQGGQVSPGQQVAPVAHGGGPSHGEQGAAAPGPPAGAPPQGAAAALGTTDVLPGSPLTPGPLPAAPGHGQVPSHGQGAGHGQAAGQGGPAVRRPTPQEIYDDLKIPDTVLSGAYANGVMIGHAASEFGLDFLTSFYPQSAVSARVFMAAGQIPRLLESLNHAMRQYQQQRAQQPGWPHPPPQPPRPDRDPRSDEHS